MDSLADLRLERSGITDRPLMAADEGAVLSPLALFCLHAEFMLSGRRTTVSRKEPPPPGRVL